MAHKAKAPSPQTINGENVPLRGILKFACSRDWMKAGSIPEVANVKLTKRETRERAYAKRVQSSKIFDLTSKTCLQFPR